MDAFYTRDAHLELLHDAGLDVILDVNTHTLFLAEVAFLNHWNRQLENLPADEGLDEYEAIKEADSPTVYITYGDERIVMIYAPDKANPSHYSLQIIWNDQLVYERSADQDERSEWSINCMANDPEVTDQEGNILFDGEPTNI